MKAAIVLLAALITFSYGYGQSAEEYHDRGLEKFNQEKFVKGIADYNKAIELKPDFVSAYNNRVKPKHKLEDYKGAIMDFTEVIELKPDYASAYHIRGHAKLHLGRKKQWLSAFI